MGSTQQCQDVLVWPESLFRFFQRYGKTRTNSLANPIDVATLGQSLLLRCDPTLSVRTKRLGREEGGPAAAEFSVQTHSGL